MYLRIIYVAKPDLIDNPIIIPDVDQELLELMQEPPIAIDESGTFEFPKHGLLVTISKINGYDGSFLFDSGFLPNLTSYETCKRLRIEVKKRPEYISTMANKTLQEIGETTQPVTIDLHCYQEKMKFVVAPCQYDIIMGKNWQTKHKAKIDYGNNHVSFQHECTKYFILANGIIEPISASALMNDYNKGFQMYSVILHNESDSKNSNVNNHEDISSVLNEYVDLFPEDLPKGLLPKRTETDFQIELKEDIKPKKPLSHVKHRIGRDQEAS